MSRIPPYLDADDAAKSSDIMIGRTIGEKFTLEKLLGSGAMGAVYRARQITLDKQVAIKVMHRWLIADPTFATRFHREAKAASRLDHPNSIRILDFGEEPDGLLYIAMDYLDGRDLLRVIQEDWPLPPWRIVDIVSQTLSALTVAHDMGVLHRDLKPENIMVLRNTTDDGGSVDLVKVCDFGIAKIIASRDRPEAPVSSTMSKQSTGGVLVGTPAYMSPEQAQGEPLDARSDLYSVGVLLYQILTMCLPFEAASAVALLLKHVHEKPQAPSLISSAVHPGLEAVCLKAMSKRPSDRYQNARQMRAALRAALGAEARPSGWEREDSSRSPGPVQVTVKSDPPSTPSSRGSNTATLPSISPRPLQMPLLQPERPKLSRKWLVGGALALGAGALFLARSRTRPPIEPGASSVLSSSSPPLNSGVEAKGEPRASSTSPAPLTAHHSAAPVPGSPAPRKAQAAKPAPDESGTMAPPPASAAALASAAPATSAEAPPPAATPVVELPPPPPPPPAPVVTAPPDPPPRPTFDPATATVEIGAATSTAGTTPASVNKAIAPLGAKLTACYRSALSRSHDGAEGAATLHVETNEDGIIMEARLAGRVAASAGPCIAATVRGRRIANVDTGSASADVPLTFKPR